mgnify:CR=1 FL=1
MVCTVFWSTGNRFSYFYIFIFSTIYAFISCTKSANHGFINHDCNSIRYSPHMGEESYFFGEYNFLGGIFKFRACQFGYSCS